MVKPAHELVPSHKVMSSSEVKALLSEMEIGLNNLPKILASDPQVQALGAKNGDVLEISRSDLGKKYKHYRYVVENQVGYL